MTAYIQVKSSCYVNMQQVYACNNYDMPHAQTPKLHILGVKGDTSNIYIYLYVGQKTWNCNLYIMFAMTNPSNETSPLHDHPSEQKKIMNEYLFYL